MTKSSEHFFLYCYVHRSKQDTIKSLNIYLNILIKLTSTETNKSIPLLSGRRTAEIIFAWHDLESLKTKAVLGGYWSEINNCWSQQLVELTYFKQESKI